MRIRSTIILLAVFGLSANYAVAQKLQITKSSVISLLKSVADYQIQTPLTHTETDWTNGALFAGMVEWASIADDDKYYNWLLEIGKRNGWTYMHRTDPRGLYHADDYCVGQMCLEMYRKYKDQEMIAPLRDYFDQIIINPSTLGLEFEYTGEHWPTERWSWCDALFMGPTVWAKMAAITGDKKYRDFMFTEYKVTTDYLYSRENSLYFRDSRFFTRKEANGQLKTYLPVVLNGWKAMTEAVWPDGNVGWIQPIVEDPRNVTREMTEVYGVGGFLLAGTEIYKLTKKN